MEEKEKHKAAVYKWRLNPENREKERQRRKEYRQRPEFPFQVRCQRLLRYYGISHEQYELLLEDQGNCCAICGATEPGRGQKHFSVDHNHTTGEVRGLLCNDCNRGLGLLGDTVESVEKVLIYLNKKEKHGGYEHNCP